MKALFHPRRLTLALLVALSAASAACDFGNSSPTAPDQSNVAYSQTDLTVGTGTEAANGANATVQYGAWLYSESAADHKGQQVDPGGQFTFVVGTNQVIKGFDQTVVGMKVGGIRRAIVPPALAYGSAGYQSIPPNAALVFDIALVSIAGS
jgi:FKBP-type peptidyl-prolyl cis-trans isomerase FkpA